MTKTLLCLKCDCYFPKRLGIELAEPATRPEPWFQGVKYTGKCTNCKETKKAFREKMDYLYKQRLKRSKKS